MLEVRNLTKRFKSVLAVEDVSFSADRGEVVGFLGPNGAGKTTTMRMIMGFLPPSGGTVIVGGHDILSHPLDVRKVTGYLPENAPTYADVTVDDFLHFAAEIRGFYGKKKKQQIESVIEKCFLSRVRHQPIGTLSKGYNQRVCFAQSILHDPEYLIMDEPTSGLDPNQKHEVIEMVREMARGRTFIISTHNLEEVEMVCNRVIIIADGRIVADDTPEGLKSRSPLNGSVRFTLEKINDEDVLGQMKQLRGIGRVEVLTEDNVTVSYRVYPQTPGTPVAGDIIRFFKAKPYRLKKFLVEEGRLDEVFRKITTSN